MGGDMRKTLNILQSAFMASSNITTKIISSSCGSLLEDDVEKIIFCLFNLKFVECYNSIIKIKFENSIALNDVLNELHSYILKVKIRKIVKLNLLEILADTENFIL